MPDPMFDMPTPRDEGFHLHPTPKVAAKSPWEPTAPPRSTAPKSAAPRRPAEKHMAEPLAAEKAAAERNNIPMEHIRVLVCVESIQKLNAYVQEEQNLAMRTTIEHMNARMHAMQQQHDSMRQVIEQQQRTLDGLMGHPKRSPGHIRQHGGDAHSYGPG